MSHSEDTLTRREIVHKWISPLTNQEASGYEYSLPASLLRNHNSKQSVVAQ